MNYEQWFDTYRPIPNPLDANASMDGCMFETFGPEVEFVRKADDHNVWTLLDCGGTAIVASGYHFVNRIGYFITQNPFTDDLEVSMDGDEA